MPIDTPLPPVENRGQHDEASKVVREAAYALRNGPVGALVVAAIAVGILFIGWLAFYFLLFMPRGPSG